MFHCWSIANCQWQHCTLQSHNNPAVTTLCALSLSCFAAPPAPHHDQCQRWCHHCCLACPLPWLSSGRGWPWAPATDVTSGRETLNTPLMATETFLPCVCAVGDVLRVHAMRFGQISSEFGVLMPAQMASTYSNVCLMNLENERYVRGDGSCESDIDITLPKPECLELVV